MKKVGILLFSVLIVFITSISNMNTVAASTTENVQEEIVQEDYQDNEEELLLNEELREEEELPADEEFNPEEENPIFEPEEE